MAEPLGRRLALTPIGLDVVAALGHEPAGIRLTPLAHAIGSPVSSVQAALRILLANELVTRDREVPPQYALSDHPAREALLELSLLLPEPAHVLGVVLRASPAVAFAVVDRDGFVAALEPGLEPQARDRLMRTLATLADARPDGPPVRLTAVSVGCRARIASAVVLKGHLERVTRPVRAAARISAAEVRAT